MSIKSLLSLSDHLSNSQIKNILQSHMEYCCRLDHKKYAPIFLDIISNIKDVDKIISEVYLYINNKTQHAIYVDCISGDFNLFFEKSKFLLFHYFQDKILEKLNSRYTSYEFNFSNYFLYKDAIPYIICSYEHIF